MSYNAVKPDTTIKNARLRSRKFGAIKLTHLTQSLCFPLRSVVQAYRKELHALHPFERVVADLTVRARQKKDGITLSALLDEIDDARKQILTAGKSYAAASKAASSSDDALSLVSKSEESLSSLFTLLAAPPLDRLLTLQRSLRSVPSVDLRSPCCVLVGSPNVGKSSLVGVLSSAKPEIADYPFTTRGVTLGHVMLPPSSSSSSSSSFSPAQQPTKCQVMDSPGLLPRSDEARNEMEDLTMAAMRHLPTGVVFVLDLSGLAGDKCSSIAGQLAVRKEVRTKFPKRPWVDVVSKVDLGVDEEGRRQIEELLEEEARNTGGKKRELLEVSVKEGTGIDTLRVEVRALLEQVGVVLRALDVEEDEAVSNVEKKE